MNEIKSIRFLANQRESQQKRADIRFLPLTYRIQDADERFQYHVNELAKESQTILASIDQQENNEHGAARNE